MENQKNIEKQFSECLMGNSRVKKKRFYWGTKCIKFENTKAIAHKNKKSP